MALARFSVFLKILVITMVILFNNHGASMMMDLNKLATILVIAWANQQMNPTEVALAQLNALFQIHAILAVIPMLPPCVKILMDQNKLALTRQHVSDSVRVTL